MRAIYDVPAPAKLNLFLHLRGRREDGLHLLQSAFMLIDWCDTLHFERRSDGQIRRHDLGIDKAPLPKVDLVVRAAQLLRQSHNIPWGVDIHLKKRIPVQAGLGGGSSDAASTLLALNRLWNLHLDTQTLAALALQLGADVPFFIHGRNAWIEGVGEQWQPLCLPPAHFVVVKPPVGLATAQVFAALKMAKWSDAATIQSFAATPYGFGKNDLQNAARRLSPQIDQALSLLGQCGLQGRMTGAGSAVFALLSTTDLQQGLPVCPPGWKARVCHNLLEHPLCRWT